MDLSFHFNAIFTGDGLKVEVRLFASLREIAKRKVLIEEVEGGRVGDIVRRVCERLGPEFSGQVLGPDGEPLGYVRILLNGRDIANLDGMSTPLKDGDVMAIFPPIGGGDRVGDKRKLCYLRPASACFIRGSASV